LPDTVTILLHPPVITEMIERDNFGYLKAWPNVWESPHGLGASGDVSDPNLNHSICDRGFSETGKYITFCTRYSIYRNPVADNQIFRRSDAIINVRSEAKNKPGEQSHPLQK